MSSVIGRVDACILLPMCLWVDVSLACLGGNSDTCGYSVSQGMFFALAYPFVIWSFCTYWLLWPPQKTFFSLLVTIITCALAFNSTNIYWTLQRFLALCRGGMQEEIRYASFSGSGYVTLAGHELESLLSQPSEYWDYGSEPTWIA